MIPELEPFFAALRAAPPALAQSRLLNTADRDLAALLSPAGTEEQAEVFAVLGPAKRRRVEEELVRMSHVRLGPAQIASIASHLAAHLAGDRPLGPASRYFKPVR